MISWEYSAGLLRSRTNYFFNNADYTRLIDGSREFADKQMRESIYGKYFEGKSLEEYDDVLEQYFNDTLKELENLVPDKKILDVFKLVYDMKNIKLIFRASVDNKTPSWEKLSENGIFLPEDVFSWISEKLLFKFPPPIEEALVLAIKEVNSDKNRLQLGEFIIDAGINKYRDELIADYENIKIFFGIANDLENIKNTLRAKRLGFDLSLYSALLLENGFIDKDVFEQIYFENWQMLLENIKSFSYGKFIEEGLKNVDEDKGYSLLEKQFDEFLIKNMKKFDVISSGPEVVVGYLFRKKIEFKNLKIILIGKLNDVNPDEIKGRVRDVGF